jgi:hypothetical protein
MLHATYMQGNQSDFQLLVVKNQIGNLTLDFFFGHNLCFRYPNGSSEPILNNIPRAFQCYKDLFNPMSFDPCNYPLKIWESIGTPTKCELTLECEGSFPHILLHSREHEM